MQDSAIQNSCSKIFTQWCWHHFVQRQKHYIGQQRQERSWLNFSGVTPNVWCRKNLQYLTNISLYWYLRNGTR